MAVCFLTLKFIFLILKSDQFYMIEMTLDWLLEKKRIEKWIGQMS